MRGMEAGQMKTRINRIRFIREFRGRSSRSFGRICSRVSCEPSSPRPQLFSVPSARIFFLEAHGCSSIARSEGRIRQKAIAEKSREKRRLQSKASVSMSIREIHGHFFCHGFARIQGRTGATDIPQILEDPNRNHGCTRMHTDEKQQQLGSPVQHTSGITPEGVDAC